MMNTRYITLVVIGAALASLIVIGANGLIDVNGEKEKYRAKLSGKNEVPKVNSTAKGSASFKSKKDILTWKLNVTGLSNTTGAQLYLGNKSSKGDIIVDLLKSGNQSKTPLGLLMNGDITASDLQGPMQGKTVMDLKSAMNNSQTFVNILTSAHPDGEIRGAIKIILPKNQTITDASNMTGTSMGNLTQGQK
jgi:CHRD domain-containing protein